MVVTARWQMSHARRPDVFQTGVLPPTQADSFLPRRSSLSRLTNDPANIRRPRSRQDREEEIPGLCNPRASGLDIDTRFLTNHPSIEYMYIYVPDVHAKQLERGIATKYLVLSG